MRSSSASTASVFALLSCCALLFGCTSVSHLRTSTHPAEISLAAREQAARYTVDVKPLTAEFTSKVDRLPAFLISITNHTQSPVSVSTTNIKALSGDHAVQVYDPSELSKLVRNDAKMKMFVATAQGASQIQAAEDAGLIYGRPAVTPARTNALTSLAAARKDALAELNRTSVLLFPSSLPPAGSMTGVVELHAEDIAPGQPLKVTVTLGTEQHTFYFDVQS